MTYCAGYPFDVTTKDSGLLMYSALTYHLPLLIGFCLPQTQFVWGGFMVFRLGMLRDDPHEILQVMQFVIHSYPDPPVRV